MRTPGRRLVALALALACAAGAGRYAQAAGLDDGSLPYVPTPEEVVERMLRLAQVGPKDTVLDLGSGDGRIVIAAARLGARGIGIEIDPQLVQKSREAAAKAGLADRASFDTQDFFAYDFSPATVITMYLLPHINVQLMPKLLKLRPGTRIVSHDWYMGRWAPDEALEMYTPEKAIGRDGRTRVLLWVVPAQAQGVWTAAIPAHGGEWRFDIEQDLQQVKVTPFLNGREAFVRGARLLGEELRMVIAASVGGRPHNHVFKGLVRGDRIEGTLTVTGGASPATLPWTATRKQ